MVNYCGPTSDGAVFPPRVGAIVFRFSGQAERALAAAGGGPVLNGRVSGHISHSIEPFDFTQSRHTVGLGLYNHSPIRLEAGGHRLPLPRNSGRNPSEASVAGTLRNDRHYGHRSGCQNHQTGNGSPHDFAS